MFFHAPVAEFKSALQQHTAKSLLRRMAADKVAILQLCCLSHVHHNKLFNKMGK